MSGTSDKTTHTVPFTEKEQRILEAVIQFGNYRQAAKSLMIKEGTVRATTFRVRLRYDNAKRFVEECEALQRRLPRKKRYITG